MPSFTLFTTTDASPPQLVTIWRNGSSNARTDKFEDLIESGVIDPTKVSRVALENAASVSGLLLTTEVTIVEKPEENAGGHGHPDMGGMGGMGGMM